MKVVHVTTVHPALDNRILFKECRSLRRVGYDVVLIAPHERDEVVEGVRIRAFPRMAGRFARMTRGVRAALALCAEEAGDLYHFHDPELMPGLMRIARSGRPVVFDMHENVVKDIRSKEWLPRPLRGAVAAAVSAGMRVWLRHVRIVFAETSYPGDYPWVADGVTVLNLPRVEELLSLRSERARRFTAAYAGSITAQRGSLLTIEAVALLHRRGVDAGFECVGLASDEHVAELRAAAARHALDGVRIHGYQTPALAYGLVARCHVGLAVLDDDANLRDSYPTKLFEYMALGLPVVVSAFPLWREVVEGARCGLCIPPGDAVALADALEILARDPAMAQRMGQNGREAVIERYRWETEETKLLALYAELLGERRGPGARSAPGPHVAERFS